MNKKEEQGSSKQSNGGQGNAPYTMPPNKSIKKEEPYSPTKDMAEFTRLTCERKIKEDEVRTRLMLCKGIKNGAIGCEISQTAHFQCLDKHQSTQVLKRKNEIKNIDKMLNIIHRRVRTETK